MKIKNFFKFVILAALGFNSCVRESVIQNTDIPDQIILYITTHFPNESITLANKENGSFNTKYEIILNNSTELEFNGGKEITDIYAKTKLPDSVIPIQILYYVSINYPTKFIKSWQLEDKNQSIELNNGFDLKFSKNNIFISIDKLSI